MLWVYGQYKCFTLTVRGSTYLDFKFTEVRFRRLKSIPALFRHKHTFCENKTSVSSCLSLSLLLNVNIMLHEAVDRSSQTQLQVLQIKII